jgi:hypothetical protein
MSQGALSFKYKEEKKDFGSTGVGGSFLYLDLLCRMGFVGMVNRNLQAKKNKQGWSDSEFIIALMLLNICGGDCVDDIKYLERDSGFGRLLKNLSIHGAWGRHRKKFIKQWRNLGATGRDNAVPSPSAVFRYLKNFINPIEESRREAGKAFIPRANSNLSGLMGINDEMLKFLQQNNPVNTATLDMDATLVESQKRDALFGYKKFKGYQGFNTWWWEQQVFVHTDFRDANVPAAHANVSVLETALDKLPTGIDHIRLRADTASYQHDLLAYCETGKNKRFGRIEFVVCCDVTDAFKKSVCQSDESDWHPIYKEIDGELKPTGQEWAEICYVPEAIGRSKNAPEYRYFATREELKPKSSDSNSEDVEIQESLPFPTLQMNANHYKLFGLVSNMDWDGEKLIHWSRKRCGYSEQVHSEMKAGFAGGKLPSGKFGCNAAWWWIMVLAFNLNAIMKQLVLSRCSNRKSWETKHIKNIRFSIINIAGRVTVTGNEIVVKLAKGHPSVELLIKARRQIMTLASLPSG